MTGLGRLKEALLRELPPLAVTPLADWGAIKKMKGSCSFTAPPTLAVSARSGRSVRAVREGGQCVQCEREVSACSAAVGSAP